ncbi:hypothetical protein SAMN05216588_10140 [Pseudomonas flavescens]|uniref:Uncharacterized protein n=1 Tax=Phytopseudomonas flavescens TaxID=29435 RepID=A0A1G7XA56_9GAMM|nr:hypothetical protein [Pseudomonas flavescens]SDG81102.1 hypothetical protein SAMN05216588_10140 [Pseudomonas flavescens]
MGEFRIYLDDQLLCATPSPVLAQAAWHRASRNAAVAEAGGSVRAYEGEVTVAQMRPEPRVGHPWPDGRDHQADLRDVWDSLLRLFARQGLDDQALTAAVNRFGLKTDSVQGSVQDDLGGRTVPSAAELVVLLEAIHQAQPDTCP